MKKIHFLILLLMFGICTKSFAKTYDISEISKAKLVTSYSQDTLVDQMDTVTFGSYPQSDSSGNTKESIEWIVLDRQDNKTLLLSKYILDCKCYYNDLIDVTWETCSLRNWLNNDFYYKAFNSDEQNKIQSTFIINANNIDYGTTGGNSTTDKVFCLSTEEVRKYFGDGIREEYGSQLGKNVMTRATNYDEAVASNNVNRYDGIIQFWLRSPGRYQSDAAAVGMYGYLYEVGHAGTDVIGVRPALWVSNLTSSISESNTIEKTNANNVNNVSDIYVLYNEIIKSIAPKITIKKSTHEDENDYETIGSAIYTGYQLYDIDGDGILELFIFREFENMDYRYNPYIDSRYTIKNNKVKKVFGNVDPNVLYLDEWEDFTYALTDGRLFSISTDYDTGRTMYGINGNSYHTEYTFEGESGYSWIENGERSVPYEETENLIADARSKIGYFNVPLERKLIVAKNNNESSANNQTNKTQTSNSNPYIILQKSDVKNLKYVKKRDGFLGLFGNVHYYVDIELINDVKDRFKDITGKNIGSIVNMIKDNGIYISSAVIKEQIKNGRFNIESNSQVKAQDIANELTNSENYYFLLSKSATYDINVGRKAISDGGYTLKDYDPSRIYIIGLPSEESELKDNHFYKNNQMQKLTWVYYQGYYYYVDKDGNIIKNKWVDGRFVGEDGKLYISRKTPDNKWVGGDGLEVENVTKDLEDSLTVEEAKSDSWYRTELGLWYYFENDRKTTKKGWFHDTRDDQWYYLDPATGIMAIGFTVIDGDTYYFNEFPGREQNWYETGGGYYESYGKKVKALGSLYMNEYTPYGSFVDENGKLVQ